MKRLLGWFKNLSPMQWALIVVFVALSILMIIGGTDVAVNSDEKRHIGRINNYLEHGYYLPFFTDPTLDPYRWNMFAYGPVFSLIAHFIGLLVGSDSWGVVNETGFAYNTRHVVVALFGMVGALAVVYAVKKVTRSLSWGPFAGVSLLAMPMYLGNSMSNVKDGPAAAGFAILTAGFIAIAYLTNDSTKWSRRNAMILVSLGTLCTIGIRPGLWPIVVINMIALFVMTLVIEKDSAVRLKSAVGKLGRAAAGFGFGYLALAAIYPVQALNPLDFFRKSLSNSADFEHDTSSTTNGVLDSTPFSKDYLFQWIVAKTPDIVLFVVLIGLLATLTAIVARLVKPSFSRFDAELPAATFAFTQIVAFPLAAYLVDANVYGGSRQFVFIYPGVAILFAISIYIAWNWFNSRKLRMLAIGSVGLATLGVALPTIGQFQLFPYSTDYFNIVTSVKGIDDRWDVDRWRLGLREAVGQLNIDDLDRCQRYQPGSNIQACRDLKGVSPYAPIKASDAAAIGLKANEYVDPYYPYVSDECRKIGAVERWNLFSKITIIRLSACPNHVTRYVQLPERPTSAALENQDFANWWATYVAWGWSELTMDYLATAPGQANALAFALPPELVDKDVLISWSAEMPYAPNPGVILHVTVNDEEFYAAPLTDSLDASGSLVVPAELTSLFWDKSLTVSFRITDENGNRANDVIRMTGFEMSKADTEAQ